MKILSIGECMLELASDGADRFKAGFAGDTFNTIWYVARLAARDVQPLYLTAVGDDQPSRDMIAFMRSAGVTPLAKQRHGKSVGLYMISLHAGERSFSYWRDSSAARTLAADLDPLPIGRGDIVYFSGITLAILPEADRAALLHALHISRSKGARVVFDPNLRPRLWPDVASMCLWTMKGAAMADICLPSFEDEAVYFGDASPQDTCNRYASNGASVVVVKNGALPITLVQDGVHRDVAVAPVPEVVDTTAAGDSFNAAWLIGHIRGADPASAAAEASLVSARVISQFGALVEVDGVVAASPP